MYTTSTTRPPIRQQHGGTLTLAKLLLAAFVREVRASPVPGAVAAVGVELGRRAEEEGMGTQGEFWVQRARAEGDEGREPALRPACWKAGSRAERDERRPVRAGGF